jgi:acylphosphatase
MNGFMDVDQSSTKRLHATVQGRVQGVNFRTYTSRKANELGLKGWVRNRLDGDVETIAEGDQSALEQFLVFLHEGSPSASVSAVEVVWEEVSNEFTGFHVWYL